MITNHGANVKQTCTKRGLRALREACALAIN